MFAEFAKIGIDQSTGQSPYLNSLLVVVVVVVFVVVVVGGSTPPLLNPSAVPCDEL